MNIAKSDRKGIKKICKVGLHLYSCNIDITKSKLQLCQAPRLDKEKEWTSRLDYPTLES